MLQWTSVFSFYISHTNGSVRIVFFDHSERPADLDLGGSEKWAADSVQAVGGATVTVRYHPLITEQCRIIKDGAVYLIVSVNDPTQKRQWLQITVKAAVNG